MSRIGVPQNYTQVPTKSIRFTDVDYPIGDIPAILSVQDIEWEGFNKKACLVRRNLVRAGYKVDPPLPWEDKVVL